MSSKTLYKGSKPQNLFISGYPSADRPELYKIACRAKHCPFRIIDKYALRRDKWEIDNEPFFVYGDGSPVKPAMFRRILRNSLERIGLTPKLYDTHSFRIGRAKDLMKYDTNVEMIKQLGRWRSNSVYSYLR